MPTIYFNVILCNFIALRLRRVSPTLVAVVVVVVDDSVNISMIAI